MQNNDGDKKQQAGLSWSGSSSAKPATPSTPIAVHAAAPRMSNTARYAGFIAAGVIIGVLVAWGAGAGRSKPADKTVTVNSANVSGDTGTTLDTSTATLAAGSDPGLLIHTPQPAGLSVAIDKAIVSEPTWVVVYEDQNGKPGNALGAALFFPDRQAGTVELLRATVSGKSYLVVKQVDNGDRKFSLKDDQLLSEGGEVQWVTFDVQ